MMMVVLSAVVSIGIALFAVSAILCEFQGRWSQVAAALAFDERAFLADLRPTAARRQARLAPARARYQLQQRVAA
jgi:hypothetical protein